MEDRLVAGRRRSRVPASRSAGQTSTWSRTGTTMVGYMQHGPGGMRPTSSETRWPQPPRRPMAGQASSTVELGLAARRHYPHLRSSFWFTEWRSFQVERLAARGATELSDPGKEEPEASDSRSVHVRRAARGRLHRDHRRHHRVVSAVQRNPTASRTSDADPLVGATLRQHSTSTSRRTPPPLDMGPQRGPHAVAVRRSLNASIDHEFRRDDGFKDGAEFMRYRGPGRPQWLRTTDDNMVCRDRHRGHIEGGDLVQLTMQTTTAERCGRETRWSQYSSGPSNPMPGAQFLEPGPRIEIV